MRLPFPTHAKKNRKRRFFRFFYGEPQDGCFGTVYILQGTITDYGPGVGWPEDRNTTHWLENRGTVPAVEISVDIVRLN